MSVLNVERLYARYDGANVLNGVNLEINEGDITALIGRNGVGKTTFVKSVARMLNDIDGDMWFNGQRINRWPVYKVARAGVRIVPENRGIFAKLTVYDNLEVSRLYAKGVGKADIHKIFSLFPRLEERRNVPAGLMSGGEQQMLSIGRALLARPQLLLVDEFSEGLQPSITKEIADVLRQMNREDGLPILLVEQNAKLALQMASKAYIMIKGQIVFSGLPSELLEDDRILKAHMVI